MTRANRDFSSTPQSIPTIPGFNPGGDDFGIIRQVDGHDPYNLGIEGSNVHQPSAPREDWGGMEGLPVTDYDSDD